MTDISTKRIIRGYLWSLNNENGSKLPYGLVFRVPKANFSIFSHFHTIFSLIKAIKGIFIT
jgi:hypothetical protein